MSEMVDEELVQRVARAMYNFWGPYPEGQEWGGERCAGTVTDNAIATARVAIKEVADWLDDHPLETGNEPYGFAAAWLYNTLRREHG